MRPVMLDRVNSTVVYLNDDGTELEPHPDKYRRRFNVVTKLSSIFCTPEIWIAAQGLSTDFEPPIWNELRLDAEAALPHVGSAIALAAVAQERFIKEQMDRLADTIVEPDGLWEFLAGHPDHYKQPSVEEMYSSYLKMFTGHSLKDEPELWTAFNEIKQARNSFVHSGVPSISSASGKTRTVVTEQKTLQLLAKFDAIVLKVREWLPTDLQWPVFKPPHMVEIGMMLLGGSPASTGSAAPPEGEPATPK